MTEVPFRTLGKELHMTPETIEVMRGVLIPFLGTSLGACCAIFLKNQLSDTVVRSLNGFGAGVMVAASVWSLIIPSIDQSEAMGRFAFVPAAVGFWVGIIFLMVLDYIFPLLTTKQFGGSKWGVWGCTIGLLLGIIGLPFGPGGLVGVFFWPFVGALVGEYLKQRQMRPALRAAWGSFLGMMAGIVVKVIYCIILLVHLTISIL